MIGVRIFILRAGPIIHVPCLSVSQHVSDHEPASARSAEVLCLPVQPNLAPLVQLRLWSVVVRVPSDFEAKLLAVVLRNSEIEHGLPKHTFKVTCLRGYDDAIDFYLVPVRAVYAIHLRACACIQCWIDCAYAT